MGSVREIRSRFRKRLYQTWPMRKLVGLSCNLWDAYDGMQDKKICGCSLVKYVPSLYRESKGATGSQSTRYCILEEIFNELAAKIFYMDIYTKRL